MSLGVGSRLGHYNVTALIGEGGMGEVYRAPRKAASAGGQRLGVCGLLVCVGAVFGSAQTELRITHGVASGEVTETSAIVWARSNREAQMEVRYQPVVGTREAQLVSSRSSSATNLSAQVRLEGLEPETQYRYAEPPRVRERAR